MLRNINQVLLQDKFTNIFTHVDTPEHSLDEILEESLRGGADLDDLDYWETKSHRNVKDGDDKDGKHEHDICEDCYKNPDIDKCQKR